MALRKVRILDTTGNKNLRTVNVTFSDGPWEKVTATQEDDRSFETVQNSGGMLPGFQTLCVVNPDVVESNLALLAGGNFRLLDGTVLKLFGG